MRFEVPQFIDVEDKIFGPLTFKQFIYLAGGAGLSYVSYRLIPSPFSFVAIAAFASFALLLAFYKLNNRPFIEVAQNWLSYQLKSKIYVWKRSPAPKPKPTAPVIVTKTPEPHKEFTEKTLRDLAQNLDILDTAQQ